MVAEGRHTALFEHEGPGSLAMGLVDSRLETCATRRRQRVGKASGCHILSRRQVDSVFGRQRYPNNRVRTTVPDHGNEVSVIHQGRRSAASSGLVTGW